MGSSSSSSGKDAATLLGVLYLDPRLITPNGIAIATAPGLGTPPPEPDGVCAPPPGVEGILEPHAVDASEEKPEENAPEAPEVRVKKNGEG